MSGHLTRCEIRTQTEVIIQRVRACVRACMRVRWREETSYISKLKWYTTRSLRTNSRTEAVMMSLKPRVKRRGQLRFEVWEQSASMRFASLKRKLHWHSLRLDIAVTYRWKLKLVGYRQEIARLTKKPQPFPKWTSPHFLKPSPRAFILTVISALHCIFLLSDNCDRVGIWSQDERSHEMWKKRVHRLAGEY